MGYEAGIQLEHQHTNCWWWSKVWKIQVPLKAMLTLWLDLNNKLLTWEALLKQGFKGPRLCLLCRAEGE